jgi:hypothetical protein
MTGYDFVLLSPSQGRPGEAADWIDLDQLAAQWARSAIHCHTYVDLTDGGLLDGATHVTGRLPDGIEPFEARFRV